MIAPKDAGVQRRGSGDAKQTPNQKTDPKITIQGSHTLTVTEDRTKLQALALVFNCLLRPCPFAREFKLAAPVSLFQGRDRGQATILDRVGSV